MITIRNYDDFLLERYGYNNIANELSKRIINLINENVGKLIYNRELTLNSSIGRISSINFINDIINIKLSNKTYGNINIDRLEIKNNDIHELIMNLEIELSPKELKYKGLLNNKIIDTIQHESLHIMERYLTKSNEKDFAKSWKKGKELQKLQSKYDSSNNWQNVSYLIYLSLPHEMRASLQQLNSEVERVHRNEPRDVLDYIKSTKIYKDVEFLSKIDENETIKRLKIDTKYNDIIKDFSESFLENDNDNYENNFLNYITVIKNKNKKLLEKLLKISYIFGEDIECPERNIDYDKYL